MGAVLLEMLKLFAVDLLFIGLLAALLLPLAMYRRAAFAVLKRNFVSYFSTPTGYVFLCFFVMATSIAAYWPDAFFVNNLANLDQLSMRLPPIMLLFVPAITMSVWAEERRQGTDELLLTLPATDFDIVLGKYLSAAAIFTVSLLFSQLSNFAVLVSLTLGDVDIGLFFTTYFGYWVMGLAMVALGMIASFISSNLTVSFILGAIFNSILVALAYASVIIGSPARAQSIAHWSVSQRFDDFGRGVVSLSSTMFFASIVMVGLYITIVLIGWRHWFGGKDGKQFILLHFIVRVLALIALLVGVNSILYQFDFIRLDLTEGQVSSLSSDTKKLLRSLGSEGDNRPIVVNAYMSAVVPDEYVKVKYNLVSMLKELERQAGSRVRVRLHDNLENFSDEAVKAEEEYGIRRQTVISRASGAVSEEEFILGVAFTCGLEQVVIPFFTPGVPVEYELIRSISTVAKGDRKTIGVVKTDAQMFEGFSLAGGQPQRIPEQMIIDELRRQYKVEEVDPATPIDTTKYDALLIVQPSTLGPEALANVVNAVQAGQPAAIFEDPAPVVLQSAVGTAMEKQPQGMMGMGGPPAPKGDIRRLWNVLGIEPVGDNGREVPGLVVWQDYNPYPRFQQLSGIGPELVFVRDEAPGATGKAFNRSEAVVAGFEELLIPFPTAINPAANSKLVFTELIATGNEKVGTVDFKKLNEAGRDLLSMRQARGDFTNRKYVLAAWIRGAKTDDEKAADKEADKKEGDKKSPDAPESVTGKAKPINVIYVCDIDMLDSQFVNLRNQPDQENNFRFDNVPFVLNVIDAVAGDDRFLQIRSRKPRHSTLRTIETRTAAARNDEMVAAKKYDDEYNKRKDEAKAESDKARAKLQQIITDLENDRKEGKVVDPAEYNTRLQSLALQQQVAERRLAVKNQRLAIERDRQLREIERMRDQEVKSMQNDYKIWATTLPPIPPLLVALVVWARRRIREREGVSRNRMRY
ncbi:multi- copper enzyme maturation ABC-type transport system permease component-like protein [Pirellula staleyi DSM 6068]|uniref:Multi-copper enzyme maturation ABC-type transport system permease component-like protein n=1 Tax=Pirellula staleyi (strain ATCC 27377 / DSM 6068 / ICPB 4128) TaxID=530564 RepID=D2QYY8_PIRSD|nr:Gldg family protein [Pirellula staleyi]ADB16443.1 multi- copper enzyme maturation ABC-type transport system permease component-like protein [Pirellula staleyi DSM 6068]